MNRKKFFPVRAVRHCTGCPERTGDHPCRPPGSGWRAVSTDGAVGVPVHSGHWDQMASGDPFQLKLFCDSMGCPWLLPWAETGRVQPCSGAALGRPRSSTVCRAPRGSLQTGEAWD